MKSMLQHSFVLDALETTAADTFSHFEVLIEEHRRFDAQQRQQQPQFTDMTIGTTNSMTTTNMGSSSSSSSHQNNRTTLSSNAHQKQLQSRLQQLVPTIGSFHTPLPLREAFEIYNEKHRLVTLIFLIFLSNAFSRFVVPYLNYCTMLILLHFID
jgi:hypothetical protein